ncbi:MAG: DUF167 domain-containing protein [Treponema sp.]|jgi:uncharacterized protein (TIGR00251 family)|nr:DUF167 domain-containing protein [Treponema sp.]
MDSVFRISGGKLLVEIKAVPGASKTEAAGVTNGRLRVRIAAAPEDGKANNALVTFFAKELGCPKRDIAIVSGEKSRLKTVAVPPGGETALRTLLTKNGK